MTDESEYSTRHLRHLRDVALSDVKYVLEKERTYRGSWKKRGGVGAAMMVLRKVDRLESMLSDRSYDILEDPGDGGDGTLLAEVRDLRRYLLLVESELVARGDVWLPTEPPVSEPQGHIEAHGAFTTRCSDKKKLHMEVHPNLGLLDEETVAARLRERVHPGTPEDGGHHERLHEEPWTIAATRGRGLPAIVQNTLYDYHHRDWWKLVPALTPESRLEVSRAVDGMPRQRGAVLGDRELMRAAVRLYDRVDGWSVLRVAEAPMVDRELWPTLRRELNHAEYAEMLDWQKPLYDRDEPAAKWVLRQEHLAWARE